LLNFNDAPGAQPRGTLLQAADGDLYGTTSKRGTVYRITPNGTLTTLYLFCSHADCVDGDYPTAGLVQVTNGDFYGTTMFGGAQSTPATASGPGTIFKITPGGTFTTLYSFCSQAECADGYYPGTRLVQAADGDLYGTTQAGFYGAYRSGGTIFKITPSGTLTTLYSFCPQTHPTNCLEYSPSELAPASDGDLYGTTDGTDGTVFKITPAGTLTTLYRFCSQANCVDGADPLGGILQAANGAFYGTTSGGGANDGPYPGGAGTVFKITPGGKLTTLYSFCAEISPTGSCADGAFPQTGLVQGNDGNFYGTTSFSGVNGGGTLFKISPDGALTTLTTLYSFCGLPPTCDGTVSPSGLVQDTNGDFYGTTMAGGESNDGALFRLSVGLRPFVKTWPPFGILGAAVGILGTDLSGATSVSFNGTTAVFTVVSGCHITATVPAGASTGTVKVVTPGGTLSSNAPFRVLP
jgi:uncharacterized repeat protein (TIGR03803 family)